VVNKISISVVPVPYPHDDIDRPSAIRIAVEADGSTTELLNVKWDATPVLEWLAQNARAISQDRLPKVFDNNGRSIAERVHIARDLVDPNDDATVDAIYDYCARHCILLAFSGTTVPDIFLGIGPGGGEISCFEPHARWSYDVDLTSLPDDVEALALEVEKTFAR
jgi:hypothetical protein